MKRSTAARLVIYLMVPGFAWLAFAYRVHIETWIWHFRHGRSDVFAKYVVPAPTNWYVDDTDEHIHTLIRLDTEDRTGDPKRDKKGRFHSVITLSTHTAANTEKWVSRQSSILKKAGVDPVMRTFDLDGEQMFCVGGARFGQMVEAPKFYESDPNAWQCWSSGWLEMGIMATDADMGEVWKIVSGIRKKS
jgi:hypothetical protein